MVLPSSSPVPGYISFLDEYQPDSYAQAKNNSVLFKQRVSSFLTWYNKDDTRMRFQELAIRTGAECESIIESMGITGLVTHRTKKPNSLETKLDGLAQDDLFRDWVSGEWLKQKLESLASKPDTIIISASNDFRINLDKVLHDPEFRDWVVGDSLKNKLEGLAQHPDFDKKWLLCEPSASWKEELHIVSSRLKYLARNPDFGNWVSAEDHISKYSEMGDLAGIRIGLNYPDDIEGVASEIEKRFNRKYLFGTVLGEREASQGMKRQMQEHNLPPWLDKAGDRWEHSGYKSWQLVVQAKEPIPAGLKDLSVEIQIGTVVSQAWAEVQHNVIYKNPDNVLATQTMKRMIDGINGLAITTDIMLRELKGSVKVAREEALRKESVAFQNQEELKKWLQKTYALKLNPKYWKKTPEWAWHFYAGCQLSKFTTSRTVLKQLVKDNQILEASSRYSGKLDFTLLLLRAASAKRWGEIQSRLPPEFQDPEDMSAWLLKLFLVANTFSFMVALLEYEAVEKLKQKFPQDAVDNMRKINAIFILRQFRKEDMEDLEGFADKFLAPDWCEEHDLALAFAHLGCFMADRVRLRESRFRTWQSLDDPDFLTLYGDVQTILLDDSTLIEPNSSYSNEEDYLHVSGLKSEGALVPRMRQWHDMEGNLICRVETSETLGFGSRLGENDSPIAWTRDHSDVKLASHTYAEGLASYLGGLRKRLLGEKHFTFIPLGPKFYAPRR